LDITLVGRKPIILSKLDEIIYKVDAINRRTYVLEKNEKNVSTKIEDIEKELLIIKNEIIE